MEGKGVIPLVVIFRSSNSKVGPQNADDVDSGDFCMTLTQSIPPACPLVPPIAAEARRSPVCVRPRWIHDACHSDPIRCLFQYDCPPSGSPTGLDPAPKPAKSAAPPIHAQGDARPASGSNQVVCQLFASLQSRSSCETKKP